jgi:splicing factor 3A subunit 3
VSIQLQNKEILLRKAKAANASSDALLAVFDDQLQKMRQYHARHPEPFRKRQKVGLPIADGYDLASMVSSELRKCADIMFTTDEVMGKYFDLQPVMDETSLKDIIPSDFMDFLQLLSKGLATAIPETDKLKQRKKYLRFLALLQRYLESFLQRTNPLLPLDEVVDPAMKDFEDQWRATGGVAGVGIQTVGSKLGR